MNAPSKTKSTSLEHPEGTYLWDDRENPCARIYCRGRKLTPTVCDGTCHSCGWERERYILWTAENLMRRTNADPSRWDSLDHDDEIITLEDATALVRHEIALLDGRKAGYIERVAYFAELVAQNVEATITSPRLDESHRDGHD